MGICCSDGIVREANKKKNKITVERENFAM